MAKADEPIKKAITSKHTEGQTILVYHDGSVKIIQENNDGSSAVMFIYAEDMAEMMEAMDE